MTTSEQKKELRKRMFEKRNELKEQIKLDFDAWICDELLKIVIEKKSKIVHAYIPFLTEINISPLLEKLLNAGITVVCPKTLPKRKLENRILTSLSDLEVGIMGTKHPAQPNLYEGKFDLIIVPGLAFDKTKKRLGYGGGYYDNFLINYPDALKVGIFYPFQEVRLVPVEAHDFSLDVILTKDF